MTSAFLDGVLQIGYIPTLYARALARTRAGQVQWLDVVDQLATMASLAWRRDVAERCAGTNLGAMLRQARRYWPPIADTEAEPGRALVRLLTMVEIELESLVEDCDQELRKPPAVFSQPAAADVAWPVKLQTREAPNVE